MKRECWYDLRPSQDERPRLEGLRARGFSGVRLMANSEAIRRPDGSVRRPLTFAESLKWNAPQAVRFVQRAREAGMERVWLTLWPQARHPEQFADLAAYVATVHKQAPIDGVEWDVEGFGWYKGLSSKARREAGDQLREAMRRECLSGLAGHATTYPGAVKVCVASLPWVETWTVQAYSQHHEGRSGYGWNERYGPGAMQRHAASVLRAAEVRADQPLTLHMGLAAYRQEFPGRSVEEAMTEALRAAEELSDVACYWSASWLLKLPG